MGAYPARPAAALTSDGILHIFLRDGFYADVDAGSFWVARYNTNTGTTAWVGPLGTGIGTLSAVAAPDGAAYAALRDASYGLWLLRENGALAFYSSGGWVTTEPSASLVTDSQNVSRVYVAGGASTAFYRRWSLNSGTWDGDWVNTGLPAAQVGLATVNNHAYMVAQTPAGQISWNPIDVGGSSWTAYQGTAAGAIASTPRDRVYSQTAPVTPTIYPDNVDVTWQPQSNGYLMSATVAVPSGSDAHNISEVRLHLENANGKDFGCNLMARPNTGVMYLADDVGEWGPNERDRYTAGRNIKPGDSNTLPDWPNNSQCTLYAEGSSFQYFQNNQRITVNFHVAFKSNIKGYFTASMLSKFGFEQSPLEDMGTYLAGARTLSATVLPTGFKNASSTFKVLSQSGNRELFFFRFNDPHGAQQLETTLIDFSPSSGSPGLPTSSGCRVMLSPMADLIWLVGGFPSSAFAGTPGTLQNGQCTVYTASSKVQYLSPTEVLVRLDVGFGGNFTGYKYLHRSVNGFNWFNDDNAHYTVAVSSGTLESSWANLKGCLAKCPASGTCTCTLSDGLHIADEMIGVNRSNVVIRGQSKYGTIVKRGSSLSTPLISVSAAADPHSAIVISDMTMDGSRTGATSTGVEDLSIWKVNGGIDDTGGFGIKIENCRFLNSGHSAVAVHPGYDGNPSTTKGIIIQNNEFRRSIRAAIHVSLGKIWWPTAPGYNVADWGGACDTAFPAQAPTDVLVKNNFFEENDTGAFGIDVSKNVQITENAMLDNQNNGLDCGGGVVAFLSCATEATATGNFIWNKGVYKNPQGCEGSQINPESKDQMAIAPAFEIWGRNITVQNNWMEYFSNEAVFLSAVYDVTVQQNTIRNASRMYHAKRELQPGEEPPDEDDYPGVLVTNCNAREVKRNCTGNDATCFIKTVSIANNYIGNLGTLGQSYGVRFRKGVCWDYSVGPETMTGISVQGNSGVNRQGPACYSPALNLSSLQPAVTECPKDIAIGHPSTCGTSGCQ